MQRWNCYGWSPPVVQLHNECEEYQWQRERIEEWTWRAREAAKVEAVLSVSNERGCLPKLLGDAQERSMMVKEKEVTRARHAKAIEAMQAELDQLKDQAEEAEDDVRTPSFPSFGDETPILDSRCLPRGVVRPGEGGAEADDKEAAAGEGQSERATRQESQMLRGEAAEGDTHAPRPLAQAPRGDHGLLPPCQCPSELP